MKRLTQTLAAVAAFLLAPIIGPLTNYMRGAGLVLSVDPASFGFDAGMVVNPSQSEVIRQRLYDYQLYATAGVGQLTFFQSPIGQGVTSSLGAVVGSPKTIGDTNMQLAGQLPSGMAYKVESVEVLFSPGSVATANTYTPAAISNFIAAAAVTQMAALNDVNTIMHSGVLEFNILQKNYLRESPLKAFPLKADIDVSAAAATNSATTSLVTASYAKAAGRPYYLDLPITIKPAINFEVAIKWPGVVATGSGFNGRMGVILDGLLMRASQ